MSGPMIGAEVRVPAGVLDADDALGTELTTDSATRAGRPADPSRVPSACPCENMQNGTSDHS